MQVHVSGKGFAAQLSGEPLNVITPLDSPITTASRGSLGGGWPLAFASSSSQLGNQPRSVHVRFSRESDSGLAAVYMLPDPAGDTRRLHALLCTNNDISRDAPVPAFLGLTPMWGNGDNVASMPLPEGEAGARDEEQAPNAMPQAGGGSVPPVQAFADLFNITGLPEYCLYYAGSELAWSLQAGELVVPAPPVAVFDALLSSAGDAEGSASQRRLTQEEETAAPVTAELYVNSQNVSSTQMAYDSAAAPNITGVMPATISAAASQVLDRPHHSRLLPPCLSCYELMPHAFIPARFELDTLVWQQAAHHSTSLPYSF